jgi:hypothetical protein
VENAPFLVAVHGIVGGVEIDDDLLRRLGMGTQEDIDQDSRFGSWPILW